MTDIRVEKLNDRHIQNFVPRDNHGVDLNTLRARLKATNEDPLQACLAVTLLDEVVAIVGATHLTICSMEFWSMPSALVPRLQTKYARAIRALCYTFMKESQAHRFVVAIDESRPEWLKWPVFLGFEMECFSKGYNPDGTGSYIFTKVWEKWQQEQ